MAAYLIRRLWQMVPTLFGVVLLVFFLFKYFGGDPAEILGGLNATPEQIDRHPPAARAGPAGVGAAGIFLKQIVSFDWGKSWATNEAVSNLFATRLPATLTVMIPILVLDVLLALPIAMWVAYRRGSLTDRTIMVVTTVALSISFLVYIIVGQYLFGFQLGWFPVQGWSDSVWTNLITYAPLPVLLAVMVGVAPQTRLYRSFFLDELGQDYVRTARAKGMTENTVLFKHVLRNAMIPILTNIGPAAAGHLRRQFLIEVFFSIPGLGREVLLAVNRSDYPVIQAVTVYLALLTMLINLLVRPVLQAGRPAGGAQVSAAMHPGAGDGQPDRAQRGRLACRLAPFPADRVGLASLVVVLLFLLLIALAAAGLVASQWQTKWACPTRRRPSWAPAARGHRCDRGAQGPERRPV
jgi:peptide/nickel transport system permease protein